MSEQRKPLSQSLTPEQPPAVREEKEVRAPEEPESGLFLEVIVADDRWQHAGIAPDQPISRVAHAIATWPKLIEADAEATVMLSNDAEVAKLNEQFRGKGTATNVLSFPADNDFLHGVSFDPEDGRRQLGDIILAWETVAQEASDAGISPEHHLQHLVLHGVLHLLGYDHCNNAEAHEMESLETAILESLGICDPYADNTDSPVRYS